MNCPHCIRLDVIFVRGLLLPPKTIKLMFRALGRAAPSAARRIAWMPFNNYNDGISGLNVFESISDMMFTIAVSGKGKASINCVCLSQIWKILVVARSVNSAITEFSAFRFNKTIGLLSPFLQCRANFFIT